MKTLFTLVGILLFVGGLTYHYARLQLYNILVTKEDTSILAVADVNYGSHTRQKLDIYKPLNATGPLPVVLFVHGGSWEEGTKDSYTFVGRALAAQGFVTLVMNYRLHPEHRYPAFVEDVALAMRWAADNAQTHGGNSEKLFAIGHSAGAYNVAMAVLDARYAAIRPKLAGVITLAGPFDFVPLDSPITIKVFGGLQNLPETQPINHAKADAPPFLIMHGTADTTVFPRNAPALDRALKGAGAQSTLLVYEGVNHPDIMMSLSTWLRGRAKTLEDVTAFIRDRSQ